MDKRGFLCTLIGGAVGGAVGFYIGILLGFAAVGSGLFEWFFDDWEDLLYAGIVGSWLGCLGGAALLLRLLKADLIRRTVGWLTFLVPPLGGGGTWLAVSLTDADDFGSDYLPYLIFAFVVITTAYLARRLASEAPA